MIGLNRLEQSYLLERAFTFFESFPLRCNSSPQAFFLFSHSCGFEETQERRREEWSKLGIEEGESVLLCIGERERESKSLAQVSAQGSRIRWLKPGGPLGVRGGHWTFLTAFAPVLTYLEALPVIESVELFGQTMMQSS